ncbi:hypothetical protein GE09DRAFT_917549, partial [Coniochaeta sp. 2T2.1]
MFNLDGPVWHAIERLYSLPPEPHRVRKKPLQVICVGPSKSGTESLAGALKRLGYDHVWHGFDLASRPPFHRPEWVNLCRKKWYGPPDGRANITSEEFDVVLGHCEAVTDLAAWAFAPELLAAYPDVKVILNVREEEKWFQSMRKTILPICEEWIYYLCSWFDRGLFWRYHCHARFLIPLPYGARGVWTQDSFYQTGRWRFRDHCNMIRGLVPEERLLEFSVEDGWEPLCRFLGKQIPDEPFPHFNSSVG